MGIELKTKHGKTLQTLFSRVPTRYCDAGKKQDFFDRHCYYDEKRKRRALYTSFSSKPDPLGFSLLVDGQTVSAVRNNATVLQYNAEQIEEALLSKHMQTVFVSVASQRRDGVDTCSLISATYCKWPSILRFLKLVSAGEVFLDFTLSERGGKLKDHGFLWRIRPESIDQLYLSTQSVDLAAT